LQSADYIVRQSPKLLQSLNTPIYIVILIAILVYVVINLESGEDPVLTRYEIGEKLIGGMTKYAVIVAIGIIGFTYIGSQVLKSMI